MNKLIFDKKTFNWGYAYIYSLLQCVFVLGFVAAIIIIILSATMDAKFTIPDALLPIFVAYIFVSIVGFPLVSIIKKGYKRLIMGSSLTIDKDTIVYDKLVDRLWTAAGHVEGHRVYTISHIDSVSATRFSHIVNGTIEEAVVHNGSVLESKSINVVKIPNAYVDMERIIKFER